MKRNRMRFVVSGIPSIVVACFFMAGFAYSAGAKVPTNIKANDLVTVTLEPAIHIDLGAACGMRIAIKHRLFFDGKRYVSQLFIPLLDTSLVATKRGMRWNTPNGYVALFTGSSSISEQGSQWDLFEESEGGYTVASRQAADAIYYAEGRLKGMVLRNRIFVVNFGENQRPTFYEIGQRGALPVLTMTDYSPTGVKIETPSETVRLTYDLAKQLTHVETSMLHVCFEYQNGLLSKVRSKGREVKYLWATLEPKTYAVFPIPPPPIVRGAGAYEFAGKWTDEGFSSFYRPVGGDAWESFP